VDAHTCTPTYFVSWLLTREASSRPAPKLMFFLLLWGCAARGAVSERLVCVRADTSVSLVCAHGISNVREIPFFFMFITRITQGHAISLYHVDNNASCIHTSPELLIFILVRRRVIPSKRIVVGGRRGRHGARSGRRGRCTV